MTTPTTQAGYLRPPGAAEYLSVSERHLRDMTRRGLLPVIRLGRRCALYCKTDLDKAMRKFRIAAAGSQP